MPILLNVKNLCTYYPISTGWFRKETGVNKAVDNISFTIREGEILGVIGESGSGKSTLAKSILCLTKPTSGQVFVEHADITTLSRKKLFPYRKMMQVVFQNPAMSLNMRKTLAQTLYEALSFHHIADAPDALYASAEELFKKVGLDASFLERYPHELSIGQQQRACLARALSTRPKLLVLDECVSALDISVQAQVLNLLLELHEEQNLSYLFISHDLAVVYHLADTILVMYQGKAVEYGTAEQIFDAPVHPYTKKLVSSAYFD